jgi:hypothetical protein
MSRKRTSLTAALTACTAAGVATWTALPANAATEECGPGCISVFSSEIGTYADPGFVEAVLDGGAAQIGQPVGLAPASGEDPSLDFLPGGLTSTGLATVSKFYADGLVSEEANARYGHLPAVQQRYAPYGVDTGLCVGVAHVRQGEDLTLQDCDDPTTVWVVYPAEGAAEGFFAIVNAATTDFDRPFAMHLPRNEVVSEDPELQMELRRLQYRGGDQTLPARQVWGADFGPQG